MTQFHGTINGEPLTEKAKETRRRDFDAFPVNVYEGHTKDGMKLRDYFAAKAMQATMSNPEGMQFFTKLVEESSWTSAFERLAKKSYDMSDAMMKAREQ